MQDCGCTTNDGELDDGWTCGVHDEDDNEEGEMSSACTKGVLETGRILTSTCEGYDRYSMIAFIVNRSAQ